MSSAHTIQANTNGRLHPAHEPSIAPLDRGFLYGDAIYEVWRTYHGVLFAWDEHWSRLRKSADALHLALSWDSARILAEIRRTVAAYRQGSGTMGELYIRLQISRGSGSIGLDTGLADTPSFVILVQPCPALKPGQLEQGLRLSLATGLRRNPVEAMSPAWKTGNYLNNILCLREARSRGADEVVILNLRGEITEAAVSNVGFVRGGALITPPLSSGLLEGITRGLLLGKIAAKAGVPTSEAVVRTADLGSMEECFLMSTTKDLVPVASIDDLKFRVTPDNVTMRLKSAFANYAKEYAAAHPELRAG